MSDEFWDGSHQSRQLSYPWDAVVSFIFRNVPKRIKSSVNVLEVGCGDGNNLWVVVREGFNAYGIDGSAAAIDKARGRLAKENYSGDLRVGRFGEPLPWQNDHFDLVIDRAALTYCDDATMRFMLSEIHRVLRPSGRVFLDVYGDSHSSYRSGKILDTGLTTDMSGGRIAGTPPTRFYSRRDIDAIFDRNNWVLRSVQRLELTEMLNALGDIHSEYRVVAEKTEQS